MGTNLKVAVTVAVLAGAVSVGELFANVQIRAQLADAQAQNAALAQALVRHDAARESQRVVARKYEARNLKDFFGSGVPKGAHL